MRDTIKVGNVHITSISQGVMEVSASRFFPATPSEAWAPYKHYLSPAGRLSTNLACFLLRTPKHHILLDTGLPITPMEELRGAHADLPEMLQQEGVKPDLIDSVVHTHLHGDHTGWDLTQENGKTHATFPNARYLISRLAWDDIVQNPDRFGYKPQLVMPLMELGVVDLIDGEHRIGSQITIISTPGHIAGHQSLIVESEGERAFLIGDVAHHPLQVSEPRWKCAGNFFDDVAQKTRLKLWDRIDKEGGLVIAGHFPAPCLGRFVKRDRRRIWEPLES